LDHRCWRKAANQTLANGSYLPLMIQEAIGISLDPSFEEQNMLRRHGVFYAWKDAAEARRLIRLLTYAGVILGL
jgi:hypothetical protein